MTLWRAFRGDPLFAVLFCLLLVCAWLPLTQTQFLPFIDLMNNAGGASMLFEAATGGPMSKYYSVNWHPVPYWTGYAIMAVVAQIAGTLFAAKFICGLLSLVLPLSVVRLLIALGRSPRQGLWAFLFVWDRNLYAGWVSFLLGMALTLYTIALLIEVKNWRTALPVTGLSALIAVTHFQALAYLAVAGITLVLTRQPTVRRVLLGALALSGGLVAAIPWVVDALHDMRPGTRYVTTFEWHTPKAKMTGLYDFTLGSFAGEFDAIIPEIVFCMLFLGPLLLATIRRSMPRATIWPAMVMMLAALALYLTLPFQILGAVPHKHNYVRYATFVFLGMLLIPRPRLEGRAAWALAPGILVALALDLHVARQLKDTSLRTQPLLEIVASLPKHSRVLPIVTDYKDPACQMAPYNQLHSYVTGATRSFDPLFFDNKYTPLLYRPEKRPPYYEGRRMNYKNSIRHYNYVLVQGLPHDPFQGDGYLKETPVRLVKEAGMWRLYAVGPS